MIILRQTSEEVSILILVSLTETTAMPSRESNRGYL